MAYNFSSYQIAPIQVTAAFAITEMQYTIVYDSGLVLGNIPYKIRYTSYNTLPYANRYIVSYQSKYADDAQIYRIKYTSGVVLADMAQVYAIKYTNPIFADNTNYYSILFTLDSPKTVSGKLVYTLPYTSDPVTIVKTNYKLKYTADTTYANSNNYTIRYSSATIPPVVILPILLREVDAPMDVLFGIYTTETIDFVDTLFVAANLPKYQLVEYTTDQTLPYMQYYTKAELYSLDLELAERTVLEPLYQCQGYIMLRDIEELNSISLDVYSKSQDYLQLNAARSFFFNLSAAAYTAISTTIEGVDYTFKNTDVDYFSMSYLNYAENAITPTFILADSCCFSQKIEQSSTGGTVCSPF